MAGYHPTRKNGLNVSQYIANLNKEPSAFEVARSEEQNYAVDDESLAQFTNADFLDFENGDFLNEGNAVGGSGGGAGLDFEDRGAKDGKQKADGPATTDAMDFVNGPFPLQSINPFDITSPLYPPTSTTYAPHLPYTHPAPYHHAPTPTSATTSAGAGVSSPTDPTSPSSLTGGDPARALAEEDKRRRNTAASARFRVKKKQREQALEQKTGELEKAKLALEQRVGQLETENEWLRGLVVEKNGGVGGGVKGNGKGKGGEVEELERSISGKKKGVGTES